MIKNLIFIRHLGSILYFGLVCQNLIQGSIADQNQNSLQKTGTKKVCKIQNQANLIFGGHLGLQKPSLIWRKKFFCEMCLTITQTESKPNAQKIRSQ
jgi:hypothetical protein